MDRYLMNALGAASLIALVAMDAGAALASNNKIVLMPGGPHPYFGPWEQAAADAKKDFGIAAVDYKVPAEWKLNRQTELMESLATQGYVGFGFFPGDAVGINSTLQELSSNGAFSAALAGCTQDPTPASFCFGTDVSKAAYTGAQALIKAIGGKGKIVHLAGLVVDPNTRLRMAAIDKAVGETNGAVTLVQHIAGLDDQEAADQKINALLAAQKDQIDGMIATAYIPSTVAAKVLRGVGDKRIKLIGMDDDKIVLDGIRDGFVAGTMAQNPYGQGYVGAYVLDLLASGCKVKDDAPFEKTPQTAKFIDSGTVLIQKSNVDTYKDDLKRVTSELQSGFKAKFLTCK
jgi:ribose transport system substrate-binding protein